MTAPMKIPEAPEELEAALSDRERVQAMLQDGSFAPFIKAYAKTYVDRDDQYRAELKEQIQAGIAEFIKANKAEPGRLNLNAAAKAGARPSPSLNNPRAIGAPLNGLFPDFYAYLQAYDTNRRGGSLDPDVKAKIDEIRAYSEKVPSEGGFLVPEEFRSEILSLAMESAIVRPRATVIPMGAPRLHIPMLDETSRVSSIFGGIVVYRTPEGEELTESQAAFASVKLDVTKQTALAHVPNELVRDWGAFGSFMDQTLPAAITFYEDLDFIGGNGVGQPLGGLSAANTALLTISGRSGQTASTIVWENIIDMYARMLPQSLMRAVWIASPDTFAQLATMALTVGTGGSAIWLTDGTGTPTLTLLGRPVLMSEKATAALGTQGDLSLVDWSMYLIGDYQTMTISSSEHVKFTSDKTTFRVIARNDGRPWINSPLTPHNNSATLSPFIQLATR